MADEQIKKPVLNEIEERELYEGQLLYEMTQSPGWAILRQWLDDLSYHSWVDPREIDSPNGLSKTEWEWRELNAFHAANNARELVERIQKAVSQSEYLQKKKNGEVLGGRPMKI